MPDASVHELPKTRRVSIFVGSLEAQGQPIAPAKRLQQRRIVARTLSEVFGGATDEEIASQARRIFGTYRHKVHSAHHRVVDEDIYRVWTGVTSEDLASPTKRHAVEQEARRLRDALHQECVLVEWGQEVWLTEEVPQPASAVRFSRLHLRVQEHFALMAWSRVATPDDLGGVFSLGGWEVPKVEDGPREDHALEKIAWRPGRRGRTAWHCRKPVSAADADGHTIRSGDLVIQAENAGYLTVRLKTAAGYIGPRNIPIATDDNPTSRLAIEFVLSALGNTSRRSLEELLDAEGTTSRFYRDVRSLIAKFAEAMSRPGVKEEEPAAHAQRLLGQLLFLRFLEEKDWLPRHGLLDSWAGGAKDYYRNVLSPLFGALDTPPSERGPHTPGAPYLNGGLFANNGCLDLPDELFDPNGAQPTALGLLYHYDFTLDESTSREELVSVDPAMLGRVLEGLTPEGDRKATGVHYTPAPVARTLATRGVALALASRMNSAGRSKITESTVKSLLGATAPDVEPEDARIISDQLAELRIVDPAVGSGALLVACLDVLLDLDAACQRLLGSDLRRGSYVWAQRARQFVRDCLYGVDISPEAIDIARLRLWLYLAVGEEDPRALPDLGYNLRVGDSLGFDEAERRLLKELANEEDGSRRLEFDAVHSALNSFRDALGRFRTNAETSPASRTSAFIRLERAEHDLRVAIGATPGGPGEPSPFAWGIHFGEVFLRPNNGFDLVIANPPYVRTSRLPDRASRYLREHYRAMARGNVDLYYAFVERCLRAPSSVASQGAADAGEHSGLAGRHGAVAFVLPNFSQVTSAEALRQLLASGGHVERWVDFDEHQVFATATNYVALLFAGAQRRRRKAFTSQLVDAGTFSRMAKDEWWLDSLPAFMTKYEEGGWDTRSRDARHGKDVVRLGDVATVEVGIQTSLDDFFLFQIVTPDDNGVVRVKNALGEVIIESGALLPCAKGSRDLVGDTFSGSRHVLWLYEPDATLMSAQDIKRRFPRVWKYLLAHRALLEEREGGRFKDGHWWRFRRPQGVRCATLPKIVVPSIMKTPTAFLDAAGKMICTASGKGGGGAWIIRPGESVGLSLESLATFLRSDAFGVWLRTAGDPKQGGWRGVDRKTLQSCPVPGDVISHSTRRT